MLCINCVFRISHGMSRQQHGIAFGIKYSTPIGYQTKRGSFCRVQPSKIMEIEGLNDEGNS